MKFKLFFCLLFSTLILSALGFSGPCFAQNPVLFEYQAEYSLSWNGLRVGRSHHQLKKIKNNHYIVTSNSVPNLKFLPFSDFEKGEFLVQGTAIIPVTLEFNKKEKRKKEIGAIIFDWKQSKVLKQFQSPESKTIEETLAPHTQNNISYIFQLRQDLQAQKKHFQYSVIEPKGNKTYTFHIIGEQNLKTPLGVLKTYVLEHISDHQERRTRLWLAKDLGFLMVKLIQIKHNKITAEADIQKLVREQ